MWKVCNIANLQVWLTRAESQTILSHDYTRLQFEQFCTSYGALASLPEMKQMCNTNPQIRTAFGEVQHHLIQVMSIVGAANITTHSTALFQISQVSNHTSLILAAVHSTPVEHIAARCQELGGISLQDRGGRSECSINMLLGVGADPMVRA